MVGSLLRIGVAAAVMGAVVGSLALLLSDAPAWITGGLGIAVGLAVYVGLSLALRAPEPQAVWSMLRTRGR